MTIDDDISADTSEALEHRLREHLEKIREEPVPPELGRLAEELQRLLRQKQEET